MKKLFLILLNRTVQLNERIGLWWSSENHASSEEHQPTPVGRGNSNRSLRAESDRHQQYSRKNTLRAMVRQNAEQQILKSLVQKSIPTFQSRRGESGAQKQKKVFLLDTTKIRKDTECGFSKETR